MDRKVRSKIYFIDFRIVRAIHTCIRTSCIKSNYGSTNDAWLQAAVQRAWSSVVSMDQMPGCSSITVARSDSVSSMHSSLRFRNDQGVWKAERFLKLCFRCTEGVGHKKRARAAPNIPQERIDDASLRLRYINQQSSVTRAMTFTTQDLLVLSGSFAMALFALNLYKLTRAAQG